MCVSQKVSKAIYGLLNSSKNWTKPPYPEYLKKMLRIVSFVRSLEKLQEDTIICKACLASCDAIFEIRNSNFSTLANTGQGNNFNINFVIFYIFFTAFDYHRNCSHHCSWSLLQKSSWIFQQDLRQLYFLPICYWITKKSDIKITKWVWKQ